MYVQYVKCLYVSYYVLFVRFCVWVHMLIIVSASVCCVCNYIGLWLCGGMCVGVVDLGYYAYGYD